MMFQCCEGVLRGSDVSASTARCCSSATAGISNAAGWRTTLDYRENLIRARDGRLLQVEPVWHAEAERSDAGRWGSAASEQGVDFITATAETVDSVWSRLRLEAELADVRRPAGTSIEARARAS